MYMKIYINVAKWQQLKLFYYNSFWRTFFLYNVKPIASVIQNHNKEQGNNYYYDKRSSKEYLKISKKMNTNNRRYFYWNSFESLFVYGKLEIQFETSLETFDEAKPNILSYSLRIKIDTALCLYGLSRHR